MDLKSRSRAQFFCGLFRRFGIVGLVLGLANCQHKPTQIIETTEVPFQRLLQEAHQDIKVTAETLIIDARTPFSYAMAHVPESINVHWADFVVSRGRGAWLLADRNEIVRRLQLKGVHPDRPILILGDGLGGQGEEAWLAWMLAHLGVERVQVSSLAPFHRQLTNQVSAPKANAPQWKPKLVNHLELTCRQFDELYQETRGQVAVIDVRRKVDYFARKDPYGNKDLKSIHMFWKNFFTEEGRVRRSMRNELKALGFQPSQPLVVLSENTLASGAVTYALTTLGFTRAQNLAQGMGCFF